MVTLLQLFAMAASVDIVSCFQPTAPHKSIVARTDLAAVSRRNWLYTGGAAAFLTTFSNAIDPAYADVGPETQQLEMKEFVDPQGLFSIRVPTNFYTLRRTQKGDLPDAKTGKGRRGSSIFTGKP